MEPTNGEKTMLTSMLQIESSLHTQILLVVSKLTVLTDVIRVYTLLTSNDAGERKMEVQVKIFDKPGEWRSVEKTGDLQGVVENLF